MLDVSLTETLEAYLNRWVRQQLSCAPAERAVAEDGIRLAYAAAGLPAPRIVWGGGPVEVADSLAATKPSALIGPNVKDRLFDGVRDRIGTFAEMFWSDVVCAVVQRPKTVTVALDDDEKCQAVGVAVCAIVRRATHDSWAQLKVQARHLRCSVRGAPRVLPRYAFDEVAISPHDLASLGVYAYLHDIRGWHDPAQRMRGLWMIAASAGWMVPHQHVCWISDRPDLLRIDATGRLHSPTGPALRYRDGWSAYVWKGVEVPAWTIEHPEQITLSNIADTFDPVLRNCLIDIMTPERFIKGGGATRVAADETGVLWRKHWTYRGSIIGSWSAVEVVNGTADRDGTYRHYFVRVPPHLGTAREAVAWSYGLSAEQYATLELRT
jgi:hypothetical protein